MLGRSRGAGASRIVTALEPETGALLARNPWNVDFGGRVAFLDLGGRQTAWTADRTEFLGRNGSPERPAAPGAGLPAAGSRRRRARSLRGAAGDRRAGPAERGRGCSSCSGEADDAGGGGGARPAHREPADLDASLRRVATFWDDTLGAVQVRTPDRSMDLMLNRWLLYQTLACRVWARSAFYQAGGAYGFRDQLQDVMALVTARRDLAREHLLRAAAHQFAEGDVQHWWHPPSGRGVRTRISDDRLWLPYAVEHYLDVTGDAAVLDEMVPFLEGRRSRPDQEDAYFAAGAVLRSRRPCSSTARAPSTGASRSARTGCR